MKKVLALVLAFAMVFSTITVAFADTEVSAEAQALATLGMLAGDGDGVTVEYTAKELTRLGAAAALLKLKGLYNEAIAFEGEDNFADVKDYAWAEGKNLMAYLKANPGLGFGGDENGNFNPGAMINEQSYYKVLLETLGYKQTTADVAGDFAWEEVLTFAEKVGLKPAKAEKFTIDELAKATFAALKANTKDGKVYIDTLVAAGVVTEELAVAAGVKEEAKAVEVAVKSAKAIGNTVVEVEYEEEVEKAAAENLDNYAIEGLEIKSALLDGTKKVLLETSAQTAGKTYTLVIGDVKINFGGAAKVTGAPELKKVTGTDTERVELEFNKVLDTVSAKTLENYEIKGVKVVNAELNSARKVVTLTTEGLVAGKSYTVKVKDVKSVDGVALKTASKSFYSKSDKTAPKIESLTAKTNTRLLLVFNEYVNKEDAANIANYTIKAGSTELAIENIKVEDNDDTEKTEVEITTASQKSGTRYELSVVNVADTSVLANKIEKPVKKAFTGKAVDKNPPTAGTPKVISRNMIKLDFNEASRLDWTTALDVNNYTINNDVTVQKIEKVPGANDDSTTVLIYVSDLGEKSTYKLTIENVADEYGNVMKKVEKSANYNKAGLASAKVSKVYSKSSTEIVIVYDKEVDPITAKDVANYTIDGDLGTPISAKINDELTEVTLKTNEQEEGKTYKVTIDGVKDLAENVITTSAKFVAKVTENDIEAPEIEDVTAVSQNIIRITFSEPIDIEYAANNNAKASIEGKGDYTYKVSYDGGRVLEFSGSAKLTDNECFLVGLTGIKDKAGNAFNTSLTKTKDEDNRFSFWGSSDTAEMIQFSYEQINIQKYKFTFDQKVKPVNSANFTDDDADANNYDTVWYWTNKVAYGKKAFDGDINSLFTSAHGKNYLAIENLDSDKKTTITADLEDKDAPYIVNVYAKNRESIKVEFNEDLKAPGSYSLYYDKNGTKKTVGLSSIKVNSDSENIVDIVPSAVLESGYVYTLVVKSEAQDLAGNKSEHKDDEFTFEGTDLAPVGNYIIGVSIKNGNEFTIKLNSSIAATNKAVLKCGDVVLNTTTTAVSVSNGKTSSFKVTLNENTLASDKTYTVKISDYEYKFEGIVESGITVNNVSDKFVFTYDGSSGNDYIEAVYGKVNTSSVVANVVYSGKGLTYDSNADEWKTDAIIAKENVLFEVIVKRNGVTLYIFEDDDNNQAAADVVSELIAKAVEGKETPTLGDIATARAQYDNLTVTQKALVDNYSLIEALVDAEEALNDLIAEVYALNPSDYTNWNVVQEKLTAAENEVVKITATVESLTNAYDALQEAVNALEPKA